MIGFSEVVATGFFWSWEASALSRVSQLVDARRAVRQRYAGGETSTAVS
ncbi:hypothetical protein [Mastigocladopsis repens]|nr:hypothetical protein [Mastigocladopsis repens]